MPTFAATRQAAMRLNELMAGRLAALFNTVPEYVDQHSVYLHRRSNDTYRLYFPIGPNQDLLLSTAPRNLPNYYYVIERLMIGSENEYRKISPADFQLMQAIAPSLTAEGFGDLYTFNPETGEWEAV